MRLTNKLYAQHLGWMFKKHWQVQGKRVVRQTEACAELQKLGITVKDVQEVLNPFPKREKIEIVGYKPKEISQDRTHPNWHSMPCHIFGDKNVLLEGIPQAQILTKSIAIIGFPKNVEDAILKTKLPSTIDRNIQNAIIAAHVMDAEQVKLPKVKLPDRPAYNLPREYSISSDRRSRLLINKLLFECEKLAGRSVSSRREAIDGATFTVTLDRDNDLLQFSVMADKLVTSVRPLEAITEKHSGELPDLYPVKCTVTIPKKNIYTTGNFFPLSTSLACSNPHTIFSYFNKELVRNLHGTAITTTQFQSRTMLKAFAVAVSRAKQLFGDVSDALPKPIVVQSIQTDGRCFHFGIFQLNTLSIGDSGQLKNYWFHQPMNLDLFADCAYKSGKTVLEGYNKDVFRYIYAFYNNS